jgi:hypothetical protein
MRDKTIEELENIAVQTEPTSPLYIAAKKELRRRDFWKKDVIPWISLFFSAIALLLHFLNYIYKIK